MVIYFDNAATTFPKPKSVTEGVSNAVLNYGGNPGRSGHSMSMKVSQKIFDIRQQAANFFGARVENVVFTSNCTTALNMAIKGTLTGKSHVITSCFEHNSVIRPIYSLSKSGNITFDVANINPKDANQTVREFERLIKKETKAIVCTHASNVTGDILPIKELGNLCKQHNLTFIVDAAQTAGIIPIKLKDMGIDILCTAGHKGLYGPTGTGLMVFNSYNEGMETILEGGTGSVSLELTQPDTTPDRFESGTANTVGIIALGAGIDFVKNKTIEKIYKHEITLCQLAFSGLKRINKVIMYDDQFEIHKKAPVLLFNIDGYNSAQVVELLSEKGFALRGGLHCSGLAHRHLKTTEIGGVRFSPSMYNNRNQVEMFLKAVSGIANI